MNKIKMVGKSGQISLGKALAGMAMNERLLDPVAHAELEHARAWRRTHPAEATDLAALAGSLGIKDE